jgi:aminoglycoside phosphotransferase (APT) family kinase protein
VTESESARRIEAPLLRFLRESLGEPRLDWAEPPTFIPGGADVRVYGLRLAHAAGDAAGPLVARVWRSAEGQTAAALESAVQNALAARGYPAPRVLAASDDPVWLGVPFQVMQRAPGEALLRVGNNEKGGGFLAQVLPDLGRLFLSDWPARLARLHARLHALDPAPILATLARDGVDPTPLGLDARLGRLRDGIEAHGLSALAPMADRLRTEASGDGPAALCHGDFFPNQVFVDDGREVVLDWTKATLAPPELDVGIVTGGLESVPVALPGPARAAAFAAQRWLARRFLAAYRAERPVDAARLRRFEVLRALECLSEVLVRRLETARGAAVGPNPFDTTLGVERLVAALDSRGAVDGAALLRALA